jgi:gamma-glutamylputrescine oxidase
MANLDLVIIGGGITGLSLGHWLRKYSPQTSFCILEQHQVGSGATGKNAGFLTSGSAHYLKSLIDNWGDAKGIYLWNQYIKNIKLVTEELVGDSPELFDFENEGSYSLALNKKEWEDLVKLESIFKSLDLKCELIQKSFLGFEGALKFHHDCSINSYKLVSYLKEQKFKKDIQEYTEVKSVSKYGNMFRVMTSRGVIDCKNVIMANNAFVSNLLPELETKVIPNRAQICAFKCKKRFIRGNYYLSSKRIYFRQDVNNVFLIGGLRTLDEKTEKNSKRGT